jgi:hypothetical protein
MEQLNRTTFPKEKEHFLALVTACTQCKIPVTEGTYTMQIYKTCIMVRSINMTKTANRLCIAKEQQNKNKNQSFTLLLNSNFLGNQKESNRQQNTQILQFQLLNNGTSKISYKKKKKRK